MKLPTKNYAKSRKPSVSTNNMRKNRQRISKQTSNRRAVSNYGADILDSASHKSCAEYIQHGDTSIRQHTISVAYTAVALARKTHLKYDYQAIVRGALLHDYFLYDWHEPHHGLHGYTHASIALHNAAENFAISPIEADVIKKHMWPLNIAPPRYREAMIVTLADKICSTKEVFGKPVRNHQVQEILDEYQ